MKEPSPYFIGRNPFPPDGVSEAEFVVLEDEFGVDLMKYWWTLRKHIGLVLAIPLVLAAFTLLRDLMATRLYTAEATVLIQSNAPRIFDQQSVGAAPGVESPPASDLFQKTEYELLQSRSLAAKVIAAEDLQNNTAFTGIRRSGAEITPGRYLRRGLRYPAGSPECCHRGPRARHRTARPRTANRSFAPGRLWLALTLVI